MRNALGWTCDIPKTKGKASKLIDEMHREIQTRLSLTGRISYDPNFDDRGDEFGCDEVGEPWMD